MWDTIQTSKSHLSHDLPCPSCGHAANIFLAAATPVTAHRQSCRAPRRGPRWTTVWSPSLREAWRRMSPNCAHHGTRRLGHGRIQRTSRLPVSTGMGRALSVAARSTVLS